MAPASAAEELEGGGIAGDSGDDVGTASEGEPESSQIPPWHQEQDFRPSPSNPTYVEVDSESEDEIPLATLYAGDSAGLRLHRQIFEPIKIPLGGDPHMLLTVSAYCSVRDTVILVPNCLCSSASRRFKSVTLQRTTWSFGSRNGSLNSKATFLVKAKTQTKVHHSPRKAARRPRPSRRTRKPPAERRPFLMVLR